ncbi:MAG TPA: esterase, partial [Burkholderiales bacterium]|nr:esterase [Burkholderiales bacterium]
GSASLYVADKTFGSDRNYQRGEAVMSGVWSKGPHTLNATLTGGSAFGSDMPAYDTFSLGGPLRLSGFSIGEFAGREMAFGRLMYYNRTIPLPDLFGTGVYAGASLEAGQMRNNPAGTATRGALYSGSVFLGANTFLGPAYFGLGAGEGGRYSIYLLLGAP